MMWIPVILTLWTLGFLLTVHVEGNAIRKYRQHPLWSVEVLVGIYIALFLGWPMMLWMEYNNL